MSTLLPGGMDSGEGIIKLSRLVSDMHLKPVSQGQNKHTVPWDTLGPTLSIFQFSLAFGIRFSYKKKRYDHTVFILQLVNAVYHDG